MRRRVLLFPIVIALTSFTGAVFAYKNSGRSINSGNIYGNSSASITQVATGSHS